MDRSQYEAARRDVLRGEELLLHGRFVEGFALLERRLEREPTPPGTLSNYLRRGDRVAGRNVVVIADQGYGDAIMFMRFIPALAALGARVTVIYRRSLEPLFRQIPGISEHRPVPDAPIYSEPWRLETWIMLTSLPAFLGTDLRDIDGRPYLRSPVARPRLAHEPTIGICWSGNTSIEDRRLRGRDVPLSGLLSVIPAAARIVCLQKDAGPSDLEILRSHSAERPSLRDFGDTAAVLAGVNLVVTIDTAVAHLAGAMGIPTWILLKAGAGNADWRWLHGRNDSPWYDSVRLFRQGESRDWAPVIAEVSAALNATPPHS